MKPNGVFFLDIAATRGPIRFYDGVISQLWAPALGLTDDGGDFMGMLAVSEATPGKSKR